LLTERNADPQFRRPGHGFPLLPPPFVWIFFFSSIAVFFGLQVFLPECAQKSIAFPFPSSRRLESGEAHPFSKAAVRRPCLDSPASPPVLRQPRGPSFPDAPARSFAFSGFSRPPVNDLSCPRHLECFPIRQDLSRVAAYGLLPAHNFFFFSLSEARNLSFQTGQVLSASR